MRSEGKQIFGHVQKHPAAAALLEKRLAEPAFWDHFAALLRRRGYATVWLRDQEEFRIGGPVAILWDGSGEKLDELAALPDLDSVGSLLFWQLLKEDVSMVETWGRTLVEGARQHHKRSQLWLQNFNLDEESEGMLESAFKKLMSPA